MAQAPRLNYILDTNIISETSPTKAQKIPDMLDWLARNGDRIFITSITVFEIAYGIAELQRTNALKKARDLELWLESIAQEASRILPYDTDAALQTAKLASLARGKGLAIGQSDLEIGGITVSRAMVLLTRNVKHFQPLEIAFHNPFDSLPPG